MQGMVCGVGVQACAELVTSHPGTLSHRGTLVLVQLLSFLDKISLLGSSLVRFLGGTRQAACRG